MNPDYIPTVFVALILTPNQAGLFDEIEAEAVDVLNGKPISRTVMRSKSCDSVFLECEHISLVLSWSTLPEADVLTLAIGPRRARTLHSEEAQASANKLRELVQRGEALFEVSRSIWQITFLPLTDETVRNHAGRLTAILSATHQEDTPFIALRPDDPPNPEPAGFLPKANGLLEKMRASYNTANEEPSWAMQASALALSSTFVLVTPPVGIAMFTYAALRQGTDMDLLPRTLDVAKWVPGQGQSRVNKRGLMVSIVPD